MFCHFWQKFSKIPKNGGHFWGLFEFLPKIGKTLICFRYSLTVRDRAISSKSLFGTNRVSKECNICNFQKIFPSPKMAAILNFRILGPKMDEKHKFASISLTVRDRAISSKFSTRTGYLRNVNLQFSKNFPLPKNGGHFEFSNFYQKIFAKNCKTQISFYLLNRAR